MAYGRSPIAPYYLNTIAKARAEEKMLEKRIKAEKEEAAKDRWLKAGMGVVDIGARFGMQAYDDYLKREAEKEKLVGPIDTLAAAADAAVAAEDKKVKDEFYSSRGGLLDAINRYKPPSAKEPTGMWRDGKFYPFVDPKHGLGYSEPSGGPPPSAQTPLPEPEPELTWEEKKVKFMQTYIPHKR